MNARGPRVRRRGSMRSESRGPPGASTSDDDREHLCGGTARLVMGWTAADIPWAYDGTTPVWHDADGDPVMTVFSWRPDRNDAQSMQVLDRVVGLGFALTMTVEGERTVVRIGRGSVPVARAEHADRRIALLRAALNGFGGVRG